MIKKISNQTIKGFLKCFMFFNFALICYATSLPQHDCGNDLGVLDDLTIYTNTLMIFVSQVTM